ncbi:hypothetical protein B0T26DRAFT_722420, partial [Lasiosphaeria miniovina]
MLRAGLPARCLPRLARRAQDQIVEPSSVRIVDIHAIVIVRISPSNSQDMVAIAIIPSRVHSRLGASKIGPSNEFGHIRLAIPTMSTLTTLLL